MKPSERVKWITSSTDNDELLARYDRWAATYDADLDQAYGWIGPQRAVDVFCRLVPRDARILDAGSGTGLVSEALAAHGYTDFAAADLSTGMLDQARRKQVYRSLHQVVLGDALDFADDSVDAVISVGVLTQGHAPPSSLDELIRITRPGGHIVFTLRTDVNERDGFRETQAAFEAANAWVLAMVSDPFQALPQGEPDLLHRVWAYRILPRHGR